MDGAPVLPYCKKPSFNGFLPPQQCYIGITVNR